MTSNTLCKCLDGTESPNCCLTLLQPQYDLCPDPNCACTHNPKFDNKYECPVCKAPAFPRWRQRIRRNVESSKFDMDRFARAVKVLKNRPPSNKVGQKSYSYFVGKHIQAALDPRGDLAHFGSHFATFHSLFVLEFERELQLIDPLVTVPYWVSNQNSHVFTDKLFGSAPGTGKNYAVIDGKFKNFPIGPLNPSIWSDIVPPGWTPSLLHNFTGDGAAFGFGQYFRAQNLSSPYVTRFAHYKLNGTNWIPWTRPTQGVAESGINLDLVHDCVHDPTVSHWMDFEQCLEFGAVFPNDGTRVGYALHGTPHNYVGGQGWVKNKEEIVSGDLTDARTSPNDPIFWPHHSNIDRTKMDWMSKQSAETAQMSYGYPVFGAVIRNEAVSLSETSTSMKIGLNDPISSSWGFTDADLGIIAHPDNPNALWTNADALCWLQPQTAPYKYEEVSPVLKSAPSKPPTPQLAMESDSDSTWLNNQMVSGQTLLQNHPGTTLAVLVLQNFLLIVFGTLLFTKYLHK